VLAQNTAAVTAARAPASTKEQQQELVKVWSKLWAHWFCAQVGLAEPAQVVLAQITAAVVTASAPASMEEQQQGLVKLWSKLWAL
jgi:hypothetical protein